MLRLESLQGLPFRCVKWQILALVLITLIYNTLEIGYIQFLGSNDYVTKNAKN
jgi:hypothetical protein